MSDAGSAVGEGSASAFAAREGRGSAIRPERQAQIICLATCLMTDLPAATRRAARCAGQPGGPSAIDMTAGAAAAARSSEWVPEALWLVRERARENPRLEPGLPPR